MDIGEFLMACLPVRESTVVSRLTAVAKIDHLEKGDLLIENGLPVNYINVLLSGVLRGFLIDKNGKDITDCFAFRTGEIAAPCHSLDKPAQISIEAITPCEVLKIPVDAVWKLLEERTELVQLYNQYLVQALERHWEIKMVMYQYSAMQRYQWFLKRYPELCQIVNSRHIASFLGITPVTLSRLRTKLKNDQLAISGHC